MEPHVRQFPDIRHKGVDPFYLVKLFYAMFDQSELTLEERFTPLLRFQESIMILCALNRFVNVAAPSQGGKTSTAEAIAGTIAYARKGTNILILSTNQDQSERLLRDIKTKLVERHRMPELRKLSIDRADTIEIKETRSKIKALPHSLAALTGNPSSFIIFDEISKWQREEADVIYSEGVARLGKTQGQILSISSFLGQGVPDKDAVRGYRGSYYHYLWSMYWKKRADESRAITSVQYPWQCSPFLTEHIKELRSAMENSPGAAEEHYDNYPRKMAGKATFGLEFSRTDHVRPDNQVVLNPDECLFLCFDPGLTKAAVLGQLDTSVPRLTYIRSWIQGSDKLLSEFVQSVWLQCREFRSRYDILVFADFAARQQNRQTNETDLQVIDRVTGQWPIHEYQLIAPGIQVIKSFMQRRGGFVISDKAPDLIDAFESGLVYATRGGILQPEYDKDGFYEHLGDAARYPVYYLCGGYQAEALGDGGAYEVTPDPYANRITGY